jgi:hypothetical protein
VDPQAHHTCAETIGDQHDFADAASVQKCGVNAGHYCETCHLWLCSSHWQEHRWESSHPTEG